MRTLLPLLLASLALAACVSTPQSRIASLYAENWEAQGEVSGQEDPQRVMQRQEARCREVLALLDDHAGEFATIELLYAATILKDSHRNEDMARARDLALDVAQRGDERGLPLAAEAIDRLCRAEGRPQRYGTQYEFDPASGRWTLCPWDPTTTDAERTSMGVPTLEEAKRRVLILNQR